MRITQAIKKILTYPFSSYKADEMWISGFSDWFGSISGFKTQTIVMLIWCVIVLIFPLVDPNMFHLMAFLTIYSAITQPILAFGNSRSNHYMIQLMKNNVHQMRGMMALIDNQQKTIEQQKETIDKLESIMNKIVGEFNEVAEDIEEINEEIHSKKRKK